MLTLTLSAHSACLLDHLQIQLSIPGRVLGQGANGRVVTFENAFWPSAVFKEGVIQELQSEADHLNNLRHPNIISMYGVVSVDGLLIEGIYPGGYLALEPLKMSLADVMADYQRRYGSSQRYSVPCAATHQHSAVVMLFMSFAMLSLPCYHASPKSSTAAPRCDTVPACHESCLCGICRFYSIPIRILVVGLQHIAAALSLMHAQPRPIVHLDLHAANIMVSLDGSSWKIIDLGCAHPTMAAASNQFNRVDRLV